MIDTGNTAFMLIAASLVLIMTPGLAFFYGGLVGRKNVLTIMMQSIVSLGVTTILWVTVGVLPLFRDRCLRDHRQSHRSYPFTEHRTHRSLYWT